MDSDAFSPQVVDSQDTADDVPPKIVKHQDLPDGLPIFTKQGGGLWTARSVNTWDRGGYFLVIEAQYSLDCAWKLSIWWHVVVVGRGHAPIWRSRSVCGRAAMAGVCCR